ncbi:MAG: 16S rRNA (cytosine(1402)-N(4))-methyltransferase RsmH [Muribaculaceae bacterium]|nr:16S rRNA (cytosine(1402)-N(4))-methyltransferase RsmH [Muribaculaceae bacterium]
MNVQNNNIYHIPALLEDSICALDIKPGGIYVDATFGGGGHSRAIMERLDSEGRLFGFDQDLDALANALPDPRFTFVRSNFRYMPNFLRYYGVDKVDGILADLGVSFHHFDEADRGFSFRMDAPLDMRMNQKGNLTAAAYINEASEEDLLFTFRSGSDLDNVKRIVNAIVKARDSKPIATTTDLVEVVSPLLNPRNEKKDMAQVFQALRMTINGEIHALVEFLNNCSKILKPGGRLAIITYHSREDRLVKNLMKTGNTDGIQTQDFFGRVDKSWKLITRSPITPSPEEIERNPRSRSAKLRVAEFL